MNSALHAFAEAPVTDDIPLIDISDFGTAEGRERIAGEIGAACTSIGFFLITGHGIPQSVMDGVFAASTRYFSLPLDLRRTHMNAYKRGFVWVEGRTTESWEMGFDLPEEDPDVQDKLYLHGPNVWPEDQPWLREAVEPFNLGILDLGERLQRLFAISLGIAEDFFVELCRKPTLHARLLHYRIQSEEARVRDFAVPEHSDLGMFTILMQDPNGGLEIQRRDGTWIRTPKMEGAFVVNVGDMLEIWTNDRYVSTAHRVIGLKGTDRQSVATFFAPSYRTSVECIESCIAPGEVAKHPPLMAGEYLWSSLARLYDDNAGGKAVVGSHRARAGEVA